MLDDSVYENSFIIEIYMIEYAIAYPDIMWSKFGYPLKKFVRPELLRRQRWCFWTPVFHQWERERFTWYSAHLKRRFRQLQNRCCFQNLILSNFCYNNIASNQKKHPPRSSLFFFQIIKNTAPTPTQKKRITLFRNHFLWNKKKTVWSPLMIWVVFISLLLF